MPSVLEHLGEMIGGEEPVEGSVTVPHGNHDDAVQRGTWHHGRAQRCGKGEVRVAQTTDGPLKVRPARRRQSRTNAQVSNVNRSNHLLAPRGQRFRPTR